MIKLVRAGPGENVSSTETSNIEKLLHVANVGGEPVIGQAVKKHLAVTLLRDAIIQQDQDAAVRPAANQPAKPLFQSDSGLRDLIIVERVSTGFPNFAQPRIHHRGAGDGERRLID